MILREFFPPKPEKVYGSVTLGCLRAYAPDCYATRCMSSTNEEAIHTPRKVGEGGDTEKYKKAVPAVSAVFKDGSVLETIVRLDTRQTAFVLWKENKWTLEKSIVADQFRRLVPFSSTNNLITNHVVLFPSEPEEYESEQALVGEIQAFIHRYVDVSALFEKIASYYVLFSWIYDGFNELP